MGYLLRQALPAVCEERPYLSSNDLCEIAMGTNVCSYKSISVTCELLGEKLGRVHLWGDRNCSLLRNLIYQKKP